MNTIPETKVLIEAMKEPHRSGLRYFGAYMAAAKRGHFTTERQAQAYKDLLELGYLREVAA